MGAGGVSVPSCPPGSGWGSSGLVVRPLSTDAGTSSAPGRGAAGSEWPLVPATWGFHSGGRAGATSHEVVCRPVGRGPEGKETGLEGQEGRQASRPGSGSPGTETEGCARPGAGPLTASVSRGRKRPAPWPRGGTRWGCRTCRAEASVVGARGARQHAQDFGLYSRCHERLWRL